MCDGAALYDSKKGVYNCSGVDIEIECIDEHRIVTFYKPAEIDEIYLATIGEYFVPNGLKTGTILKSILPAYFSGDIYFTFDQNVDSIIPMGKDLTILSSEKFDRKKYVYNEYVIEDAQGFKYEMIKRYELEKDSLTKDKSYLVIEGFNHKDYKDVHRILGKKVDVIRAYLEHSVD